MELPMQALSPSEATTLGWPAENTGVWHESCSQQVISLLTGLRIRQIRAVPLWACQWILRCNPFRYPLRLSNRLKRK
ncbi:uncharacterized protein BO96DRAFT_246472 [Aspergillus niger CBS 101883]|uniref:uncharacterized protein n=1 Tax=Aspergillus lacticoffeatus (strain CBS 101883) TaxID=1450533 RepID=UPI000D805ED2|nr:uncharacterized protein BO96DRAFT_246472 [Aspergillus niger CBS 101883]PYH58689.1 hypothetical protein BO96DRAFT_246472 [Aspergillus niger CBS 101883]